MKIIRSNLSPGVTVLLILFAVLFAFIIIPLLIITGFCWIVFSALTGISPAEFYRRRKERRHGRVNEGPFQQESSGRETHASNDDTIECEVISARTLDENGQEIR